MDGEGGDPFDGWSFDEEFVAGADRREESAEARLARIERIRRDHRRLEVDAAQERRFAARGSRRERRRRWLGRLVIGGVLAIVAVAAYQSYRGSGGPGLALPGQAPSAPEPEIEGGRPPASEEHQEQPLGVPAPHAESSSYRFLQTQEGSEAPVAYDPCRPIHVVVNARTQPPGGDLWLAQALQAASRATGLQFIVDGPTTEVAAPDRKAYQPDRYGERWAPVLVEWGDEVGEPDLGGTVAGQAGSTPLRWKGDSVYLTGVVVLDGPQLAELAASPLGPVAARDVVLHEVGHLLGLDHVADPGQLMYAEGSPGVSGYQAGDLSGLDRLGRGRCFPDL